MPNVTVIHKTRTTRPRRAGAAAISTDFTEVYRDGTHVMTITWGGALLRRLARDGMTRDDYLAKVAGVSLDNSHRDQ